MNILKTACWLCLAAVTSPSWSQPVQVSEAEFAQLSTGLPLVVEDFNRFPNGPAESPVTLLNGQFSGSPSFGAPWCLLSTCLTIGLVPSSFSSLPPRTVLWSTRLIPASGNDSNIYDFDIVGGGGTQRISLTGIPYTQAGTFIGFHDPLGIQQVSVSVRAGSGTNYSLDDVATVTGPVPHQPVPAASPAGALSLSLLLLAIGGVALRRR